VPDSPPKRQHTLTVMPTGQKPNPLNVKIDESEKKRMLVDASS